MAQYEVGTQNTEAGLGLERLQRRRGLVAVLSTAAAAVGLDSLQGRPPMAVMAVLGVAIRLVLAVLVESMMAMAVLMEHPESSDVVMVAEVAVEAHPLAWVLVEMEERQVVAAEVVEEEQA